MRSDSVDPRLHISNRSDLWTVTEDVSADKKKRTFQTFFTCDSPQERWSEQISESLCHRLRGGKRVCVPPGGLAAWMHIRLFVYLCVYTSVINGVSCKMSDRAVSGRLMHRWAHTMSSWLLGQKLDCECVCLCMLKTLHTHTNNMMTNIKVL